MTVDGGVAVGFCLWFMESSAKKSDGVRIQGVSERTFSTGLYGKLWEHVVKTAFLIMKYGYNDISIMNSSWKLHQPTDVLL